MSAQGYSGNPAVQVTNQLVDNNSRSVEYLCGDCDSVVALKRGEPIRCRNCGHRVLYKQRTNRMVQFEAR
ncbi:DNA directed RNA polymerase [Clohesyomyces aquaticus]|uniref:DNA directed RNA polymerase n=1 Tax=Clohesyomyces aquaticus TaxID=1231657 RepID=A0A1Y1ZTX8_9PLEO|nr:DNA directed RNA polymerase [Clohesyomyces aquaticus]